MFAAILAALQAIPGLVGIFNRLADAYDKQVAVNEANARLQWSRAVQTGLQPLEQGQPTTDAQKLAAAKAAADAWANMPK